MSTWNEGAFHVLGTPFRGREQGTFSFPQCKSSSKPSFLVPRSVIPRTLVTMVRTDENGEILIQYVYSEATSCTYSSRMTECDDMIQWSML